MSLLTSLRNYSVFTILLSCASLAIANSAQAAAFSNDSWNFVGNNSPATNPVINVTLTNNINAAPPAEVLPSNWQSIINGIGQFGTPDDDSTSASMIWQTFDAAAGDTLSFNWLFSSQDTQQPDFGFFAVSQNLPNFVTPDAIVSQLQVAPGEPIASNPYTYTFGSTGKYTIGIGVSNWRDDDAVSTLTLSNINYTAIPTPALLPGLVGVGIGVIRRQRGRD